MPQPFSLTGGNMKYSGVGGQAVMEGVMMKNEDRYAVAVRKPDHTIDVKVSTFKETIKNKKLRRLPFIRGVINFIESLILGMQTLMYSASFFEDDEDEKKKKELFNRLFIHLASSSVCWDLFCIIYFIYLLRCRF